MYQGKKDESISFIKFELEVGYRPHLPCQANLVFSSPAICLLLRFSPADR